MIVEATRFLERTRIDLHRNTLTVVSKPGSRLHAHVLIKLLFC